MAAKARPARAAEQDKFPGKADRASQAYRTLRELIVHGRLAPGTRIVEREVARRLGISRTPVHGAVRRLQQEGYVVAPPDGPRTRPLVAPLTREDAREVFEIVAELEGLAARRAAELDPAARKALVATMTRFNEELVALSASDHPDPNRRFENDTGFHRCCVEVGAGPRLQALYDAAKPQAERYIRLYISLLTGEMRTSATEHAAIIDAIAKGKPEGAQQAVRKNWRNAAERLARVIDRVGESGSW